MVSARPCRVASAVALVSVLITSPDSSIALAQETLQLGFEEPIEQVRDNADARVKRWRLYVRSNERTAEVKRVPYDENDVVKVAQVKSKDSFFALFRAVPRDSARWSTLNWHWKARRLPRTANALDRSKNDQVLQVMAVFEKRGRLSPYPVLSYIWDSNAPVESGSGADSRMDYPGPTPWGLARVHVRVLQSGQGDGGWRTETRNLVADYRDEFNDERPGDLLGIVLLSDTDHTKEYGEGCIGKITLRP